MGVLKIFPMIPAEIIDSVLSSSIEGNIRDKGEEF